MAGIDPIPRDIARLRTVFDLAATGLGEKLLDLAVEGVIGNFLDQSTPDGQAWAALSEAYAAWKAKNHPNPIGTLYDLLSQESQIRGERTVSADRAEMLYGTSEDAKVEACFFSEGNDNQPPRPFYGLSGSAIARIDAMLTKHLARSV